MRRSGLEIHLGIDKLNVPEQKRRRCHRTMEFAPENNCLARVDQRMALPFPVTA